MYHDYYRSNRRHLAPWEPVRPESFFTEDHWRRQVRGNAREFRQGRSMRLFMDEVVPRLKTPVAA